MTVVVDDRTVGFDAYELARIRDILSYLVERFVVGLILDDRVRFRFALLRSADQLQVQILFHHRRGSALLRDLVEDVALDDCVVVGARAQAACGLRRGRRHGRSGGLL
jgi:hypothetical protein